MILCDGVVKEVNLDKGTVKSIPQGSAPTTHIYTGLFGESESVVQVPTFEEFVAGGTKRSLYDEVLRLEGQTTLMCGRSAS